MITSGCMGQVYFSFDSAGEDATVEDWAVWAKAALAAQIVSEIDKNKVLALKSENRIGLILLSAGASPASLEGNRSGCPTT
jgi:hypothetical protein